MHVSSKPKWCVVKKRGDKYNKSLLGVMLYNLDTVATDVKVPKYTEMLRGRLQGWIDHDLGFKYSYHETANDH